MKTFREIQQQLVESRRVTDLAKKKPPLLAEQQFMYDDLDPESQAMVFDLALDMMHELCARKAAASPSSSNPEQTAQFVAAQYAGVDSTELLNAYANGQTSGQGFTDAAKTEMDRARGEAGTESDFPMAESTNPRMGMKDQLASIINSAQEALEFIEESGNAATIPSWFSTKISDANYEMKDIPVYIGESREKEMAKRTGYLNSQFRPEYVTGSQSKIVGGGGVVQEKLDPGDPIKTWIDDFIASDDPRFEGKSKKERIQMALGAYYSARKDAGLKTEEEIPLEEKLDPKDPLVFWEKEFLKMRDTEDRFKGKSDEKMKEVATAAWLASRAAAGIKSDKEEAEEEEEKSVKNESTISGSEFDKIMVSIMNSDISEKFLDAVEEKNEKLVRALVKSQVKDPAKIEEIVDRVMKG